MAIAKKQTEIIGLRFTISEAELIKHKAGLIPVATFIKDILAKQTTIFDESDF